MRYSDSASPLADGVALQASSVRRSCSTNHSPAGSATASFDHGVSMLRRLFSAQL
jgi:hypothetical protein